MADDSLRVSNSSGGSGKSRSFWVVRRSSSVSTDEKRAGTPSKGGRASTPASRGGASIRSSTFSGDSQTALRATTAEEIRQHGIALGLWVRFRDTTTEKAYASSRFEASGKALLFMWAITSTVSMLNLIQTHAVGFDYNALPTGALVVIGAQCISLLIICQVPLFVWKFGSRFPAAFNESLLLCSSTLGLFLVAGPCNSYRVGRVFHGDGLYLWKVRGYEHAQPSDMAYIAGFIVVSVAIIQVPLVRVSRAWPHLLASFIMYIGLTVPMKLSPEPFSAVAICTLMMSFYYPLVWLTKRSTEVLDRRAWDQRRRLEKETKDLRDGEEERRQSEMSMEVEAQHRGLRKAMEDAVEQNNPKAILAAKADLLGFEHAEWTDEALNDLIVDIRKKQSEERGVRLSYLLSKEFLVLAQEMTGKDDPTFYDMKDPFFLGPKALGKNVTCPRDGGKGCAMVDWLKADQRATSNYFLSWTWGLRLSVVRDGLKRWADSAGLQHSSVSFYMCFFVNNQYRILTPDAAAAGATGSDNLELAFEGNLTRIGKMVALLDTYDRPRYLTRIWTIFEQFTAMKLGVEVAIALPSGPRNDLIHEFERGKDGIMGVQRSMAHVDSKNAMATEPKDEQKVKAKIIEAGGFKKVNDAIKRVFSAWIGVELRNHMDELIGVGAADRQDQSTANTAAMEVSDAGAADLAAIVSESKASVFENQNIAL